ncbi:DUF4260 domain-containing protein [Arcticibacterium luteifluviistationis]|uniref:DUF4260 domain-containing protein n=1 Tax=Arcticibacterium luteifluviistationis TaxID=1784714 RepID=A0A2Z4GET6_9BACT|nr:DUF4260 domain-containing protein [Arcticibacterium luteifluviistationis]AWV99786.1 DUF4260 domain-containing protein [Arcticibacterium luteifluviistationis]
MKKLLSLEELAQFAFGIFLFSKLSFAWWWFPVLIFLPDLSMLGYLFNAKIGAWVYNFFHHKALGIVILTIGFIYDFEAVSLTGIILFSHSALDRVLGYGLKHETDFKDTHLGRIGK